MEFINHPVIIMCYLFVFLRYWNSSKENNGNIYESYIISFEFKETTKP